VRHERERERAERGGGEPLERHPDDVGGGRRGGAAEAGEARGRRAAARAVRCTELLCRALVCGRSATESSRLAFHWSLWDTDRLGKKQRGSVRRVEADSRSDEIGVMIGFLCIFTFSF